MKISSKVMNVEYAIRDIVLKARLLEQQGKTVHYFNIGDPAQYGFQPPENVRQAFINAINNNENYYCPSEGIPELRSAIAKKEHAKGLDITLDDIQVTAGVSEGLDMLSSTLVEDGDEVLLPGPYYPPYASYIRLHGGIPIEYKVDLETSKPDLDDIRSKITSKTIALFIINPNNPTGAVFSEQSLYDLVSIANEHDLYIVCDEIYDQIVFDKFSGIGKVAKDSPVIILNGFSKVHLMTGWRLGYIAFNGASPKLDLVKEHLPKLARVRLCTTTPVQYAAIESLNGPQEYIKTFVAELKIRRDLVVKRFNEIPNLSCPNPSGAFYVFPKIINNKYKTDYAFVLELLNKEGILTVHGSGFGETYGKDHFRFVYLADIEKLNFALDKINHFMSQ